jgi:integration host factor subunit beta
MGKSRNPAGVYDQRIPGEEMTRKELIQLLAQAEGITLKAAELAVSGAFESITQTLLRSGRIEIRGFGSFKMKSYQAYQGRNPVSGEAIKVKPKKLPFFKVGKELRQRVNTGNEDR